MSAPTVRDYHRPTVQALGSVSELTRGNGGSGTDGNADPEMRMVASDLRLKEDVQPLLG